MPSRILCYRYLIFSVHILCFFSFSFVSFLCFCYSFRVGDCIQNSRIKQRPLIFGAVTVFSSHIQSKKKNHYFFKYANRRIHGQPKYVTTHRSIRYYLFRLRIHVSLYSSVVFAHNLSLLFP